MMICKFFVALAKLKIIQNYYIRKYSMSYMNHGIYSCGELVSYGGCDETSWKLQVAMKGLACNRLVQILLTEA